MKIRLIEREKELDITSLCVPFRPLLILCVSTLFLFFCGLKCM